MKRRLVIRPDAAREIREAGAWYRATSSRLRLRFLSSVDTAIREIRERPLAFQLVDDTHRRMVLNPFPYSIFYEYDEAIDTVFLVALFHQARDPQLLEDR